MKTHIYTLLVSGLILTGCSEEADYKELPIQTSDLGKEIFFDTNLSNPGGQSCASCHAPETGFSDPLGHSQSEGVLPGAFGSRNSPALSYNVFAPKRFFNFIDDTYVGGLFLDGRADDLKAQMIAPMLNPVEMNNTDIHQIASKIKTASYYSKIVNLYGKPESDQQLMLFVSDAIAKFETSEQVNPFSSKFDYYSKGLAEFTSDEKKGLDLFQNKAKCANCHVLDKDKNTGKILFTDFTYDNIGVPKNPNNPFYSQPAAANPAGNNFIDLGIGTIVNDPGHNGKFKVPTLRNIAISAPYFHNGAFKTLNEVIRFYNRRDLNTGEFGQPEVSDNVNKEELGNLNLTETEEHQLELFLLTLTDHYK
jgi:cytochrome c peroxidase